MTIDPTAIAERGGLDLNTVADAIANFQDPIVLWESRDRLRHHAESHAISTASSPVIWRHPASRSDFSGHSKVEGRVRHGSNLPGRNLSGVDGCVVAGEDLQRMRLDRACWVAERYTWRHASRALANRFLARVYRVGGDKNDFALFPT
jgi:hypothetical protein